MVIVFFITLLAGAALTVQAGLNNQLREGIGNPVLAALISFAVGAGGILLYLLFSLVMGTSTLPSEQQIATTAWWKWLGGLLGAVYVVTIILVINRLGATTTTGLIIAGQLILALVVDHYGWFGVAEHTISPLRLLGAVFLLAGVYCVQRF
jgi:transporter family-2 protein